MILNGNPFLEAYSQADMLGKLIFFALYALSISSWSILLYKAWITRQAKKHAFRFHEAFQLQKLHPLSLECGGMDNKKINPFFDLYQVLKKHALELLTKNRPMSKQQDSSIGTVQLGEPFLHASFLSFSDINALSLHLSVEAAQQIQSLEKHLYILSTTVTLAPFLGLLGTVWGILTTFSELQAQSSGSTHHIVLGGLSLALATTVLGLLDAIPALIGYNYLKNAIGDFSGKMESFCHEILAAVERQYRKVP